MKGLGIGCTPTVALCVGKVVRGQRIWGKPRVEIKGQVVGKPRAGGSLVAGGGSDSLYACMHWRELGATRGGEEER